MEPAATTRPARLSDRQALAVLGGYFGARMITSRFLWLPALPWALVHAPWILPLLRNLLTAVVPASAASYNRPGMLVAVGMASLFVSTVAGMLLYWAGWRFGGQLAERAAQEGSVWASIWNPKQVAKAHAFLERRGIVAVVLSRATGILLTPICLVAGSSDTRFRRFAIAHTIGAVIWTGVAVWLGYQAGTVWPWLPDKLTSFAGASGRISLVLLALVVVLLVVSAGGRKKQPQEQEEPSR